MKKRGTRSQIGIEYLIIIAFVTLAVLTVLVLAYFFSGVTKDQLRISQSEQFGLQLVNSGESVFFAGEPSEATISLYLPNGVKNISIESDNVVITTMTSSGENKRAFKSDVPIQGYISPGEGIKRLRLKAEGSYVSIGNAP